MSKIIADTTCRLPLTEMAEMGIDVIPQIIIFDENLYRDVYEIDNATFLAKLKETKALPKTSAPPPTLYEPILKTYAEAGESVMIPTSSSDLSGTYRPAQVASESVPEVDLHILVTRTFAGGLGSLVKKAHQKAIEGQQPAYIIENLE